MSKRLYYIILIVTLSVVGGFLMPNVAVAQSSIDSVKVTIELNNESLLDLFKKVESQSRLYFAYRLENVEGVTNLNLAKGTRTIKETLDIIFLGTGFSFRQVDNSILITGKKNESLSDPQPQTITGKVTDKTGSPLPGVSILVKGTSTGTATDGEGKYTITAKDDDIITFSFIGYKSFETSPAARIIIDVTMEEDTKMLGEVVINGGYYETTDKLKTGSIVKVTAKDIERQPVTSPLMALQGRVPGLEVTPVTGAPGTAPTIRIRGTNSLRITGKNADSSTDGNYPLYVIDGVPISSAPLISYATSFTSQGFDPLSTINAADIANIEILKDGDATAIYGSRGANGVILITTKRNQKTGEQTTFDATLYSGIGQISRQLPMLNTQQYVAMRKEAIAHTGQTFEQASAVDLYLWDTTRQTNWQKELLGGNARINDFQTGISAGTSNTSFRFSGGYHKESLIFPGDFGYQRLSGQLSLNHSSKNQKFRMSVSTSYGLDKSHYFIGDLMYAALTLPPNAPRLYNNDGTLNWELRDFEGFENTSTWINPLSNLRSIQDARTHTSISNASLSYEVLPGVTLMVNAGLTDVSNKSSFRLPASAQSPSATFVNRTATFSNNDRMSWIIEPRAMYTKKFGQHQINVVTGGTWQQNTTTQKSITGDKYSSDALLKSLRGAGQTTIRMDEEIEYKYVSAYARLGYSWKEKYIVNLSGRRDGSSRFGPGNRFGNFASVGAAWIFTEENLFKRTAEGKSKGGNILNFGKLRASYGITGSDNIGDYNYYNLYASTERRYGGLAGSVPYSLYNADYAWEVTNKLEAALELGFLENRVALEINWYRNRSSNQLVNYPLSEVTGFPSVQTNFDATIQNSGWETILRLDVLNSATWRWNTSVNFSLPQNKLVRFDGIENSPYASLYKVGSPLTVQPVYTWTGVNSTTGVHEFVDRNGDGLYNDSDKTLKDLTGRIWYGGITNSIQYENFELSFLFQFSHRQTVRLLATSAMPGTNQNQPVDALNRWQEPGDITNVQRYALAYENNSLSLPAKRYELLQASDYNVTDASFIRLKTLSLSWRFPSAWLDKAGLQQAMIFVQGQNLATFTKYKGLDPETGMALPPLRMLTLGLQVKL